LEVVEVDERVAKFQHVVIPLQLLGLREGLRLVAVVTILVWEFGGVVLMDSAHGRCCCGGSR